MYITFTINKGNLYKRFKDDFVEDAIDVTKYISFALLFNAIVLSCCTEKVKNTDYRKC